MSSMSSPPQLDPSLVPKLTHLLAAPSADAGPPAPALHLADAHDEAHKLDELVGHFGGEGYAVPEEEGAGGGEREDRGLSEWEMVFLSKEGLLRFLVAMRGDVPATIRRIEHALRWRRAQRVDDLEHFARTVAEENTNGGQIVAGYSRTRQPVIVMVPARRETPPTEVGLMHLFFMFERAIDLMPPGVGKVTFFIDFAGKRKYGTPIGLARQWVDVLQKCYPERLGLGLITHIPWAVNLFLTAAYAFMDPITKAKIRLNPSDADLPDLIPPDQLLATYGGAVEGLDEAAWAAEGRAVYAAYWAALLDETRKRREVYLRTWREMGASVGLEETRWREAYEAGRAGAGAGPETASSAMGEKTEVPDAGVSAEADAPPAHPITA